MTPNPGSPVSQTGSRRRPRDMALVSVSLISLSLIWAGTHQLGRAAMEPTFYSLQWVLAVALLIAGGFLLTSLIVPVDIRQRIDVWTFVVLGGLPILTLGYTLYAATLGELRVIDKLLGWASPFGITAMAILVGFAGAASFRVIPPAPTPSMDPVSDLTRSE